MATSGVGVVDAHAHIVVGDLLTGADALGPSIAEVRTVSGRRRLFVGGRELSSVVKEMMDAARMLVEARAEGIDHLVLSPWVQVLPGGLPLPEARRRCEVHNAALAQLVDQDPRHLSGLAAVPIDHPSEAAAMLVSACEMGLSGIEVAAGSAGYLGDPSLEPLWSAAEARRAIVFVHPATHGMALSELGSHYLWNTLGNPFETTIAAAHLVLGGVLERHPDLRVLLAHGGGALPALVGRLGHGSRAVGAARGLLQGTIEDSLGRLYYDSITHDPRLLRELVDRAGPDHVLLGSDRPFDMGDPDSVGTVRRAGLSPAHEAAVLGENAARLLGKGS